MFFWNTNNETPLTQAVIYGNVDLVKRLAHHNSHRKATNFLGFNAEDLALFLGNEEMIEVLGLQNPRTFRVQKKGESEVVELGISDYEQFFGLKYLASIRVVSYRDFCKIVKKCPGKVKNGVMGETIRSLFETWREKIKRGYVCESTIKWIDERRGYGLYTDRAINKGEFVGEYIGLLLLRRIFSQIEGDYCMRYPKLSHTLSYYTIDAEKMGNEIRFINHDYVPNLQACTALENGIGHCVFTALRDIDAGEQLTYDYGEDYWRYRDPPVDF